MADKYRKPCLDSSVFIGGLNAEIANGIKRGVVFQYIWQKAKAGEFSVFISAITLAEVYKLKRKATLTNEGIIDAFLELMNETFVQVIEVDREIGLAANGFCRSYADNRLTPNDALILAGALRAKCDVLLAWDVPLVTVAHPDIRIEEPAILDRTLFTDSEIASKEEIQAYDAQRARKETQPRAPQLPRGSSGPTEGQAGAKAAKKPPQQGATET